MLLPVHDSVLFEARECCVEDACHAVIDTMESVPEGFSVPLEVKLKAGKTWAECKPVSSVACQRDTRAVA